MRSDLIQRVRDILAHAGYYLSEDSRLRPVSFDLVARRDGELLIVKILRNVDSLSDAVAQEVRVLAQFLNAQALLVGERSSSREIEEGVVYVRHGIPIMTVGTLGEFMLDGVPPLVYAAPGGFYVTIDGKRLRSLREERGLSLGQVAEAAGVSRRAISMYEQGMGAMVDVAARLEEYLDEALVVPVDPLTFRTDETEIVVSIDQLEDAFQREIFRFMTELGFRLASVRKGPFQGIAKEEGVILTGVGGSDAELKRKSAVVSNLCDVAEAFGAFFVEGHVGTRQAVNGLPLLTRHDLLALDEPSKVMRLLEERRGRRR